MRYLSCSTTFIDVMNHVASYNTVCSLIHRRIQQAWLLQRNHTLLSLDNGNVMSSISLVLHDKLFSDTVCVNSAFLQLYCLKFSFKLANISKGKVRSGHLDESDL